MSFATEEASRSDVLLAAHPAHWRGNGLLKVTRRSCPQGAREGEKRGNPWVMCSLAVSAAALSSASSEQMLYHGSGICENYHLFPPAHFLPPVFCSSDLGIKLSDVIADQSIFR